MARSTLDIAERDTAALFRADADSLGVLPFSPFRRAPGTSVTADNDDDDLDEQNYERNPTRDRTTRPRRKLTSDQESLARKSGQQITDEMTIQGVENANSGGISAERVAIQRAAASAQSSSGWLSSTMNSISNTLSNAWDGVTNFTSKVWNGVTEGFDKYVMQPLGSLGDSIKSGFNNYIAQPFNQFIGQPVANFAGAVADKFSTYVAQPVSNAASAAASTFSTYVGEPVSNMASSAASSIKSGWNSALSYVGLGGEESKPAAQTAAAPRAHAAAHEAKPSAEAQPLSGEKSNPSTGWSLSGMFHSATNALGITSDEPAPAVRAAPSVGLNR